MESKSLKSAPIFYPYIIAAIFFLPFILNNAAFNDDYYKQLWGESHFMQDGRPVAEFILRIFSLSNFSVDNISPLTWVLSIFILGGTCAAVSKRFSGDSNLWLGALSSLIFCTPAYLENAFFKFDNLTMSIALSIAVLAAIKRIYGYVDFIIVCVMVLGYLSSYQVAMTAYIIISLMLFSINFINGYNDKKNITDIFLKASALIVGFVLYSVIKPLMPISKYAMEMGRISSLDDIYSNVIIGTVKYVNMEIGVYDRLSLFAIAICSLISILFIVYRAALHLRTTKKFYSYLTSFVAIFSVPASFFLTIAPLTILQNQPEYLRLLVGLGSFVYMVTFLSCKAFSSSRYLCTFFIIISFIPAIDAITKSYVANNAYQSQYELSKGISIGVLDSLSAANVTDLSEIKYTTYGPLSYEAERAMKDYPFLSKIIRGGFVAIPHWAGYDHQSKVKVGEWVTDKQNKDACSGLQIAKHLNYDIYIQNRIAFVDLTKSRCKGSR